MYLNQFISGTNKHFNMLLLNVEGNYIGIKKNKVLYSKSKRLMRRILTNTLVNNKKLGKKKRK